MKPTMQDFISAAATATRPEDEIILDANRRPRVVQGRFAGHAVTQRPNTSSTDARKTDLDARGKALRQAFEWKYMYGRKLPDSPLDAHFYAEPLKAAHIQTLVEGGKQIRRSLRFVLERHTSKAAKGILQQNQDAFDGCAVNNRSEFFGRLACRIKRTTLGPIEADHDTTVRECDKALLQSILDQTRKAVINHVCRAAGHIANLKQADTETKRLLAFILFHPSMAELPPEEGEMAMKTIAFYFMRALPKEAVVENAHNPVDALLDEKYVWWKFFRDKLEVEEGDRLRETDFIPRLLARITGSDAFRHALRQPDVTLLHWACRNWNTPMVRLLLGLGADPEARDSSGRTPLHAACRAGNLEIARLLAESGARVDTRDNEGHTTMHAAAFHNNLELFNFLHQRGVDPAGADHKGRTSLHVASTFGSTRIVEFILQIGLKPNTTDREMRAPLHEACQSPLGSLGAVEALLRQGADTEARDRQGRTPLHYASMGNKMEIIKCLVAKGADVRARDHSQATPLHYAYRVPYNGGAVVAEILLDSGADLQAVDKDVATPLHLACRANHETLASLLIDRGADLTAVDHMGATALHKACGAGVPIRDTPHNHLDHTLVQTLCLGGADPQAADTQGATPLHWASRFAGRNTVKVLLYFRADINVRDQEGATPLHWACRPGLEEPQQIQVVEALLEQGMSINAMDKAGRTPLWEALQESRWATVRYLLDHGAALDVRTCFAMEAGPSGRYRGLRGDSVLLDGKPCSRQDYLAYSNDFLDLYTHRILCDYTVTTADGQTVSLHKKIFRLRTGLELTPSLAEIISRYKATEVLPFFTFLYSGIMAPENEKSIREIFSKFKSGGKAFFRKNGPLGLRADITELYHDESSKDFTFMVGEQGIKVHRLVLAARTSVFRSMFTEVNDEANEVKPLSGMSYDALRIFIEYLYTDNLDDEKLNQALIDDLKAHHNFFLFNTKNNTKDNPFSFINKLLAAEERLNRRL